MRRRLAALLLALGAMLTVTVIASPAAHADPPCGSQATGSGAEIVIFYKNANCTASLTVPSLYSGTSTPICLLQSQNGDLCLYLTYDNNLFVWSASASGILWQTGAAGPNGGASASPKMYFDGSNCGRWLTLNYANSGIFESPNYFRGYDCSSGYVLQLLNNAQIVSFNGNGILNVYP